MQQTHSEMVTVELIAKDVQPLHAPDRLWLRFARIRRQMMRDVGNRTERQL